jgi:hypothetical protein
MHVYMPSTVPPSPPQAYPEFCRQVFDAAPEGFQASAADSADVLPPAHATRGFMWTRLLARQGALAQQTDTLGLPLPPPFLQVAVAELQSRHGKAAQRRYVLLSLWMARQGAGVLPGKAIVDAARRLRVS